MAEKRSKIVPPVAAYKLKAMFVFSALDLQWRLVQGISFIRDECL